MDKRNVILSLIKLSTRNSYITLLLAAMITCTVWGCNPRHSSKEAGGFVLSDRCPEIDLPAEATVLKKEAVSSGHDTDCCYMIRLSYPDKEPSYALWILPREEGIRPSVMMTAPYDGIRWNGDSPPDGTVVFPVSSYVESGSIFLANGFGVLHVFGRFYTGDNLQNEVDDMTAGLRMLKDSLFVDPGKIGIWGASWGGFESIYGAANAPSGAVPAAGVSFFPPVDFVDMVHYITSDIPENLTDPIKKDQYETFFQPYLARIYATDHWNTWTADALLAKLSTPFLVVHDEWDTLVQVSQSQYLVNNSGGKVTPVWLHQASPVDLDHLPFGWDHGELRWFQKDTDPPPAFLYPMMYTMAASFLIGRLKPPGEARLLLFDDDAMNDFVSYLRDYTCGHGRDTEWARERLLDLSDSMTVMIEVHSFSVYTGAEVVASAFSANSWGSLPYYSPLTIEAALQVSLPACP